MSQPKKEWKQIRDIDYSDIIGMKTMLPINLEVLLFTRVIRRPDL